MNYLLKIVITGLFVFSDGQNTENLCNVGQSQSPVNIDNKYLKRYYLPTIEFYKYELTYTVPLINTGDTVMINFEGQSAPPFICQGILGSSDYLLDQIHFHWEAEHTIDRIRFPLEAHFVHYLKNAGNYTNALTIKNGVVLLTVLYEYSYSAVPTGFSEIIKNMQSISQRPMEPVNINFISGTLLPKNLNKFFFYNGSLTTPDCNEDIQWIIFDDLAQIESSEYQILTKIYSNESILVTQNNRPLQPLNRRAIKYSPGLV